MSEAPRNLVLAAALSALAGYVDGAGFLHLSGLYVSFMSGNSTRMGVDLAEGHWQAAAQSLGLIALFTLGATLGSLIVLSRAPFRQSLVLLAESLLLAGAAWAAPRGWPIAAIVAMVLAMGLENAVFQIEGGGGLGLTYVTGALVKFGQHLAAALAGRRGFAGSPALLLWLALVAGVVGGSFAYLRINLAALWFAALVALALGAFAAAIDGRKH